MLKIHPDTLAALEADAARRQPAQFGQWWAQNGLPPGDLEARRQHAAQEAAQLGIEDDEDRRISLYAAAFALMPEMDGIQFLQVSDILFLDEPAAARLERIRGVAARGPTAA
ncbi:hypothetical protein [Sphingomonas sp.]|uniref:hypothetical protein n=1 Tax=Sphingomonas sp. TaxID=28214 RepID=UPI003CC5EF96